MPNLVEVTYDQTGKSKSTNALEMSEMGKKLIKSQHFTKIDIEIKKYKKLWS